MKALITGGAGFIGSHLAERLLSDGHDVVVLDNLSTGRLENIEAFREHVRFQFIRGDIRDTSLVQLLAAECDVIFHLAAAVGVQLIADDPVRTIETNIGGTETVLEIANKFNRRILIASTSEVYGKSESIPFREEDDLVLGSTSLSRWSYACSKAVDEFLGQAYYQQYGLGVVIARFFNTIGPRQTGRYGMVVPRFVEWALKDEPICIYGTGAQSRCFCYVQDVVDAVVGLMQCDRAVGQIFNVGSSEEVSIKQLADKVVELTGSRSAQEFVPYEVAYGRPIEDMMRRVPSTERIRRAIGWQPKTSLDETLRFIIAEHRGGAGVK
ncbi:MAG: SDR family NAD(P)-dependent oxidoreductase [Sedimentisphaerales bacterium]|jgi:UDP-glucose 4-epimerase|nr:SDR family NAD(P)-dependent oxidoreductase [Sedimentisphaerales bacterium]NLT78197.1 SDR family NAD(P)-dependent oxidoreductase [Planctomycetota bacterium]